MVCTQMVEAKDRAEGFENSHSVSKVNIWINSFNIWKILKQKSSNLFRKQRLFVCSIATWTCVVSKCSITCDWGPRWSWKCGNISVIYMVRKLPECSWSTLASLLFYSAALLYSLLHIGSDVAKCHLICKATQRKANFQVFCFLEHNVVIQSII